MSAAKNVKSTLPRSIYLGSPTRSPIGKFGGGLKGHTAPRLAALVLQECVKRAGGLASGVDFVYLGHARQAGCGPNTARQATIFGGLPDTVPAQTVNLACASGLTAILQGAQQIAIGRAERIFAGGVESMSNTPYLLPQARWGYRMGTAPLVDGMHQDGFFCPMSEMVMGATVENFLVPEFKISRDEQDRYALASQDKAARAWKEARFAREVVPLAGTGKGQELVSHDEHLRSTTLEQLAKLPAVFDAKAGTISAGNSSGITDAAAFVEVSSQRGSSSIAELLDCETVAIDPRRMGVAPVPAVQNLMARHGLTFSDISAVELNEAFAAQVIACQRTLKIPDALLNQKGGSIALGHPIGATGARIMVTLLETLREAGPGSLGIATLCVSGGHGVAALVRTL
jgi:acetyl-CoA C-acetyltransferase